MLVLRPILHDSYQLTALLVIVKPWLLHPTHPAPLFAFIRVVLLPHAWDLPRIRYHPPARLT